MSKEVDETLKRVYEKSNILEILLQNELDNNFIEKRFNELLKLFNVKKGDTIIDLGANIGQQVDYALDVGATIHCFEPHPRIFKFLEKKYSDNNSVILKNKAAGIDNGNFRFFYKNSKDEINGGASLLPWKLSDRDSLKERFKQDSTSMFANVKCIDISEYILQQDSRIKILKIDVEGFEYAILDKLISTGTINMIDVILFEDHRECFVYEPWFDTAIEAMTKFANLKSKTKILNWRGSCDDNVSILEDIK